jgi:hypothetical protein
MERIWVEFWSNASEALHYALSPFRAIAEALGFSPSDIQIWMFLLGLFVSALVVSRSYGDLVLRRRYARASGRVVAIDRPSEAASTPTIEFHDSSGKVRRFRSGLPINRVTGNLGAEVPVIYDPLMPDRAREAGRAISKALDTIEGYAMIAILFAISWYA